MRGYVGDVVHYTGLHEGLELEIVLSGMSLIAHLGDDVRVLECGVDQQLVLKECAAHRLFAIHVHAFLDGAHRDGEVREIRCGDKYRLYLTGHLVEHLAEVLVVFGARELAYGPLGVRSTHIDIAEGYHVAHTGLDDLLGILLTAVAYANECDLDFLKGCDGSYSGGAPPVLRGGGETAERAGCAGRQRCGACAGHLDEISSGYHWLSVYMLLFC